MSERLIALFGHQAVHPGEVPGNFEVVTHNASSLVNTPLQVMGPVLIELLVHEGAVSIVREVFANGVERIFQKLCVVIVASSQIKVDQIGRGMISNRVPVLLRFVDAQ